MILTNQNYHSNEANKVYWSNSQYKDFLKCEGRAMAKLSGWSEPPTDALLVGSYVHAYFEGKEEFEEFKLNNPEILSSRGATKGQLKSEYRLADQMIQTIENSALCMFVLQGKKEVIMTGEFAGALWKIKIDNYAPDRNRFADIKTVASIDKEIWDPTGGYVTFVEANGYTTQMSLYAEIERINAKRDGWIEPLIVAVSKQSPPDKAVATLYAEDIQRELDAIKYNMPRLIEVKSGEVEPRLCGRSDCAYCRQVKELDRIVHYSELINR